MPDPLDECPHEMLYATCTLCREQAERQVAPPKPEPKVRAPRASRASTAGTKRSGARSRGAAVAPQENTTSAWLPSQMKKAAADAASHDPDPVHLGATVKVKGYPVTQRATVVEIRDDDAKALVTFDGGINVMVPLADLTVVADD